MTSTNKVTPNRNIKSQNINSIKKIKLILLILTLIFGPFLLTVVGYVINSFVPAENRGLALLVVGFYCIVGGALTAVIGLIGFLLLRKNYGPKISLAGFYIPGVAVMIYIVYLLIGMFIFY